MINYDLTPAEWASGSVTMRFLVENYPKKVIPTFFEGRPCLDVTSVTKVKAVTNVRISKLLICQEKWGASLYRGSFRRGIAW